MIETFNDHIESLKVKGKEMDIEQIDNFMKSIPFCKLLCEAEEKQATYFSMNIHKVIDECLPELTETEKLDLIELFETHLLIVWYETLEDELDKLINKEVKK